MASDLIRKRVAGRDVAPLRFAVDTTIHAPIRLHAGRKEPVFERRIPAVMPARFDPASSSRYLYKRNLLPGQEADRHQQEVILDVLLRRIRQTPRGTYKRAFYERDLDNWIALGMPVPPAPRGMGGI